MVRFLFFALQTSLSVDASFFSVDCGAARDGGEQCDVLVFSFGVIGRGKLEGEIFLL